MLISTLIVIELYIKDRQAATNSISFAKFLSEKRVFITENPNGLPDYKDF